MQFSWEAAIHSSAITKNTTGLNLPDIVVKVSRYHPTQKQLQATHHPTWAPVQSHPQSTALAPAWSVPLPATVIFSGLIPGRPKMSQLANRLVA